MKFVKRYNEYFTKNVGLTSGIAIAYMGVGIVMNRDEIHTVMSEVGGAGMLLLYTLIVFVSFSFSMAIVASFVMALLDKFCGE